MDLSAATPELFAALSKAQGEFENASKNAVNPHFKSRYADLAEVLNTLRPVLSRHGLAVLQGAEYDGERVHVSTCLVHSSGGRAMTIASCVPARADAQGIGAATTYLRRYALAGVCGIAQEDDDGAASVRRESPRQQQAPAPKPAPAQPPASPVVEEARALVDEAKAVAAQDAADPVAALLTRIAQADGLPALQVLFADVAGAGPVAKAAWSTRRAEILAARKNESAGA